MEDFFFLLSKKYQNFVSGLTHCKTFLKNVHIAGVMELLVDLLGQKRKVSLYLVVERQFSYLLTQHFGCKPEWKGRTAHESADV